MVVKLVPQSGPATQRGKFVRRRGVEGMVGLQKTQIYFLMRKPLEEGGFPRPVRIGARAVAWLESEVLAWMDARIAESEKAQRAEARKGGAA